MVRDRATISVDMWETLRSKSSSKDGETQSGGDDMMTQRYIAQMAHA